MSIRLRLTLLYSVLLAVILIAFGLGLYLTVSHTTYEAASTALTSEATAFAAIVPHPDPDRGTVSISLPPHATPPELYTQILLLNGTPVYQSPALQVAGARLPLDPAVQRQAAQGLPFGPSQTSLSLVGQHYLLCTVPVTFHGAPVGILQLARPLQDLDQTLNILRAGLLLSGLLGTLAAFAAGWVLAGAALRPIDRITQTAQEIGAAQDFARRLDYTGPADEVGRLAGTFNTMLARLQAAYQAQRRFVADASHELRTPLTSILGNLGLLKREPPIAEADRVAVLDDVTSECERLGRLVNDLLILARSDAGRPLQREPVPLRPLLAGLTRQLAASHPERTVELEGQLDATVLGDRDALRQVLLILLDNALKFTPPEGTVGVAVAAGDGQVSIGVRDTGVGIPPEALPRVFDRFYQADTMRAAEGTGLGLAIAKSLVERQGGTIGVQSTVGRGSTFTIRLPRAVAPEPAAHAGAAVG